MFSSNPFPPMYKLDSADSLVGTYKAVENSETCQLVILQSVCANIHNVVL